MSEDKDNELLEDIIKTADKEIDPIAETNESLITMDSAPFDQTLEIMSQTLASIDVKMGVENSQLQKLDQLSEIKDQLNRLENISVATAEVAPEPEVTAETETENEIDGEIPQSSIGHNQQEIYELLEKIQTLENKILAIESQSNNVNERFKKIENVVGRFENLENEIPSLFKNLFKKKEKTELYKKKITIDKPEAQLETVKTTIPKDTVSIIEEAENSLENKANKILLNEEYNEEDFQKDEKPKSNNLKYGLRILLLLCVIIVILFFFNKFQIIDLNFDKVMSSVFSLIDLARK